MQRQLKNFRCGITTGEAVQLAKEMGTPMTRQTVRNIIGSGFIQTLDSLGGWHQIDATQFSILLEQWGSSSSEPIEAIDVSVEAGINSLEMGPYHVKRKKRAIPSDVPANTVRLSRGDKPD